MTGTLRIVLTLRAVLLGATFLGGCVLPTEPAAGALEEEDEDASVPAFADELEEDADEETEIGTTSQAAILWGAGAAIGTYRPERSVGLRGCPASYWIDAITIKVAKDPNGRPYGVQQINARCRWIHGELVWAAFYGWSRAPVTDFDYASFAPRNHRLVGFGATAGDWIDSIAPVWESFISSAHQFGAYAGNTRGGAPDSVFCRRAETLRGVLITVHPTIKTVLGSINVDCSP